MRATDADMGPGLFDCEIIQNKEVLPRIFLTRFHNPHLASASHAGQFVNVLTSNGFFPLLRKPFSVCRRDRAAGWFEILYRVIGEGTRLLSEKHVGQTCNILGPLGRGYSWVSTRAAAIVAGGLGVAPLPILLEEMAPEVDEIDVFIGARSQSELWGLEIARDFTQNIHISTDDGSRGFRGTVATLFERFLDARPAGAPPLQAFACGPEPLLQRMLELGRARALPTQISVETMMGCGFGICVGCPMPPAEDAGAAAYRLSCLDGPVFHADEVNLKWQI